jgi:predicted metalloprotease with PDZ domain
MISPIHYKITPSFPGAHRYTVQCEISEPHPEGQSFFLPTWIPGSYKIRDFAKHVMTFEARSNGKPIECLKTEKHTWKCEPCAGPLIVEYQVYANDPSIRGAALDITRGFLNPSSLCVLPEGYEEAICEIELMPPEGYIIGTWNVATALESVSIDGQGFGVYRAKNYAELIDSPIEMAPFARVTFAADNIPHQLVMTEVEKADLERIANDVKKLCEYWINFFGVPCPFNHYVFLVKLASHAYGGLEHRSSTSLQFSRFDLPTTHEKRIDEKYREFLSLCSHEYFHTWHVKRIRPQVFTPYDLRFENYTRTLWVFEGITAYYQDLALVRSKLLDVDSYIDMIAHNISKLLRTPGRKKQSLADSSFDAWIKFYDPNENSPNSGISYYQKGGLLALLLDLALRERTQNKVTLDDVMRAMWKRYGDDKSAGVAEYGFEELVRELVGDVVDDILALANTTDELPLEQWFATVGLVYTCGTKQNDQDFGRALHGSAAQAKSNIPSLGITLTSGVIEAIIATVYDDSAAQQVGLSSGDTILAINGWRVNRADFYERIARYEVGSQVTIHAYHADRLLTFPVTLQGGDINNCELLIVEDPAPEVLKRRNDWLGIS